MDFNEKIREAVGDFYVKFSELTRRIATIEQRLAKIESPAPAPAKPTRKFADGQEVMISDDASAFAAGRKAKIVKYSDFNKGCVVVQAEGFWGYTVLEEKYLSPLPPEPKQELITDGKGNAAIVPEDLGVQVKEPEWRDPIPGIDEGNPTAEFRDRKNGNWLPNQGAWEGKRDGMHLSMNGWVWNFARVRDHGKHVAPPKPKKGEWVTPVKGRDEGKVCRTKDFQCERWSESEHKRWHGVVEVDGQTIHVVTIGSAPACYRIAEVRAD